MNKFELSKKVTSFVVASGTGKIVGSIIANNIQAETKWEKITTWSASFVIGMMAAGATQKYVEGQFDDAANWIKEAKNELQNKEEKTEADPS